VHSVAQRPLELFQPDVMLGAVPHRLGNAGLAATLAVVPIVFRQVQVAVDHRPEPPVETRVAQVHAHDTVVDLPRRPAVLSLHARGLVALLGVARLVDDPDRLGVGVVAGHHPLHRVTQAVVVPLGD